MFKTAQDLGLSGKKLRQIWQYVSENGINPAEKHLQGLQKQMLSLIEMTRKYEAEQRRAAEQSYNRQSVQGYVANKQAAGSGVIVDKTALNQYLDALNQVQKQAEALGIPVEKLDALWQQTVKEGPQAAVTETYRLQKAIQKTVDILDKQKAKQDEIAASERRTADIKAYFNKMRGAMGPIASTPINNRLAGMFQAATKEAQKLRLTSQQIDQLWGRVIRNDVDATDSEMKSMYAILGRIFKLSKDIGLTWKETQQATRDTKGLVTMTQYLRHAGKQAHTMLISWQSIFRITSSHLLYRGVAGISSALRDGLNNAIKLQQRVAEIQTIDSDAMPFRKWLNDLRELSDTFGTSLFDQAEAAYQALSNQIVDGIDATQFLAEANKFAATTVSSSATAVNLLTAALNSYYKPASDAHKISAQLFKTIELGRVRADEMENTYGRVAIMAHQLNIQQEELNATIATLTIQGIHYAEASTQLRGILIKLMRPTTEMKKFFASLGVTSGEAAVAAYGFGQVLAKLQEWTRGSSTELAKLVNRIRGISGMMAMSNHGLEIYLQNYKEILKAENTYDEKTRIVLENTGKRLAIEMTKLRNFFRVDLGNNAIEVIHEIITALGGVENAFKAISKTLFFMGSAISLTAIAAGINQIRIAVVALGAEAGITANILSGGTVAAVWVILSALTTVLEKLTEVHEGHMVQVEEEEKAIEKLFHAKSEYTNKWATNTLSKISEVGEALKRASLKALSERNKDVIKDAADAIDALDKHLISLKVDNASALKQISRHIKDTATAYRNALSMINGLRQSIKALAREKSETLFNFKIEGLSDIDKVKAYYNRIVQLQREANKVAKGPQTKESIEYYKYLTALARRYLGEMKSIDTDLRDNYKENQDKRIELIHKRDQIERDAMRKMRQLKIKERDAGTKEEKQTIRDQEKTLIEHTRTRLKEIRKQIKDTNVERGTSLNYARMTKQLYDVQISQQKEMLEIMKKKAALEKVTSEGKLTKELDLDRLKRTLSEIQKLKSKKLIDIDNIKDLKELKEQYIGYYEEAMNLIKKLGGDTHYLKPYEDQLNRAFAGKEAQLKNKQAGENQTQELRKIQATRLAVDKELKEYLKQREKIMSVVAEVSSMMQHTTIGDGWRDMLNSILFSDDAAASLAVRSDKIFATISNLKKKLDDLLDEYSKTKRAFNAAKSQGDTKAADAFDDDLKSLEERMKKVQGSIKYWNSVKDDEFDVSWLKDFGEELTVFFAQLAKAPNDPALLARLEDYHNRLAKIRDQFREVKPDLVSDKEWERAKYFQQLVNDLVDATDSTKKSGLQATLKNISNVNHKLLIAYNSLNTAAEKTKTNLSDINKEANNTNPIDKYVESVRKLAREAMDAAEGTGNLLDNLNRMMNIGEPQHKAVGGFAVGGFAGVDSVPAILAPGEFVMNSKASKENFSQLLAMNNGMRMAQGGNTTYGDFNITVNTSGGVDAREVAHEIRREIHRGTIRKW